MNRKVHVRCGAGEKGEITSKPYLWLFTGGSAQAHAFHVLMGCAKYTLAMTGTLMNGYSSNLFELIFRMYPKRMKEMGFNWGEVGKWIDLYGVREKVTKIRKDSDLNSSSNGASSRTNIKELPAAAPQLFTDVLSDVACFIQLADMFEVLPKLKEGPMNVCVGGERKFISCVTKIQRRPDRRKHRLKKGVRLVAPSWYLRNNLNAVSTRLRSAVNEELQSGKSVLLGSLLNTLLSYPDVPFNFEGVYHPNTGKEIVSPRYRLSDRVLYPKELQLLKFVRSRIKAGRKVGIYATYTGKLGTLQRLQTILEERGFKTAILESNVNGPEREEWIAEREREGIQVLLTNPILVSTGLDLLGFPSLYFYQTGYRLSVVRQASRRHWRIGQKNFCETVYSGYKGTMQELAINLMAAKMSAALALEGQFTTDGLSALTEGTGGSLATELAKRFVGNKIDGVESAESIWGKMTIDATQYITPAPASMEELNEAVDCQESSEIRSFYGETMEKALLAWATEIVPLDMLDRFKAQIEYAALNIQSGFGGISITKKSLIEDYEIKWNPAEAPMNGVDFRRWVFSMTNKPVGMKKVKEKNEWKLELVVEGKKPRAKTKKAYNISEGQIAFNF